MIQHQLTNFTLCTLGPQNHRPPTAEADSSCHNTLSPKGVGAEEYEAGDTRRLAEYPILADRRQHSELSTTNQQINQRFVTFLPSLMESLRNKEFSRIWITFLVTVPL